MAEQEGRSAIGWLGCASAIRPIDDIEVRAMRAAPYIRGKDVLDIGAGEGRLSWVIAASARSVVGVDPDVAAVRAARREARRRGLANVRFVSRPAQDLRLGPERFDTALFSWSL